MYRMKRWWFFGYRHSVYSMGHLEGEWNWLASFRNQHDAMWFITYITRNSPDDQGTRKAHS